MTSVAIVGVGGSLCEGLTRRLSATKRRCFHRLPTEEASGENGLAARGDCDAWVFVPLAGVGSTGVPDLDVAQWVVEQAVTAGVEHLVVVASAATYEPSHHHAGHVFEEAASSCRRCNPVALAWWNLERLVEGASADSPIALTILRPAAVIQAEGRDLLSQLLTRRWALTLPGYDPSLQVLSQKDLAAAVTRVLEAGRNASGTYHVTPSRVVPLGKALQVAGSRRVPMPFQGAVRRLLGGAESVDQLDYLRYSWTVSGDKIRESLGFEPRFSSVQALFEDADADSRARPAVAPVASSRSATVVAPEAVAASIEAYDDFGMDKAYVERLSRSLFRFLHDCWWRVEWKGLENVPPEGRAILAGVHRGHQPWDGVMTFYLLVRELGRYPRYLIHPTLVKFPFLAPFMIKCGGVHACQENARRILERDGLLAIFPEGVRGAFAMYRDAYTLGRFGRDQYVKIALRHQAPIIPYVTVGSAEIFPILGRLDWNWWKRLSEWPFLPITPTMGTIPLPSKWHTWFLEPIPVDGYPPEAAEDRETVKEISQLVRSRMEAAIAEMLDRRKSIWWGSIFEDVEAAELKEKAA